MSTKLGVRNQITEPWFVQLIFPFIRSDRPESELFTNFYNLIISSGYTLRTVLSLKENYKLITIMKFVIVLFFFSVTLAFSQEKQVTIELSSLKSRLRNAKMESASKGVRLGHNAQLSDSLSIVKIPMVDGTTKSFYVEESPIWEDANAMKEADIRTYSGISVENDGYSIRFTVSPLGFSGMIKSPSNYYVVEVINVANNIYKLYPLSTYSELKCGVDSTFMNQTIKNLKKNRPSSSAPFPNGTQLRTYRMAAAATGEFVANIGGGSRTTALAKMTEIMNLINSIFINEVSMKFSLIAETTDKTILFTDSANDPFSPTGGASAQASQDGFDRMAATTGTFAYYLPYNKYDIGHTFHYDAGSNSGSGQAGPTPCTDTEKAAGWSMFGIGANAGLVANTIAHEIGHQFGAGHTYNARGGTSTRPTVCSDQWQGTSSIEPGSGTTLLSYGGLCTSPNYNLTGPGKDGSSYFHSHSIEEILQSDGFLAVNGTTCGGLDATGNALPVANAGVDFTLPVNTPFTLIGSATDANPSDILTYNWEQYDVATLDDKGALGSTIEGRGGYTAVVSTTAPLFRSYAPSTTGYTRTFPDIAYVLNNSNAGAANAGEDLPQVGRTMKFRLTVRDNKANGGGIDSDERILTVDANKGPFSVTYPNGGETINAGDNLTITWQVNNTATISPSVKILLSNDGGITFPFILAASTTNDGEKIVTLPANIASSTICRIKIVSTVNPTIEFFDVSNTDFTISSNCIAKNNVICPTNTVTGQVGNAIFNLALNNKNIKKILNNIGTYSTVGQIKRQLYCYSDNTFTTCQSASGFNLNSIVIPFRVSQTGDYEITALSSSGNPKNFSIYNSATIGCGSFVGSTSYVTNSGISSYDSKTLSLSECTDYYAVVYFGTSSTPTIELSVIGIGDLYEPLVSSAGVNYTYVAVNQNTNLINSISSTSNFTSLGAGTYNIYGLQYANTLNPNNFINQTINQVYNSDYCLLFSANSKTLNIIGNPCVSTLALVSPSDDIGSGNVIKQASSTFQTTAPNANITASNRITGNGTQAIYQAKSILLQNGFFADTGTIFKAEIGGCNN